MHNLAFILLLCSICIRVDVTSGQQSSNTCRCPNEEYAEDHKRPQNTCETYGCYAQSKCPGSSNTGDCYCKKGYARQYPKGPCISIADSRCAAKLPPTPEDCSKRENEVYKDYVGQKQCAKTCKNYLLDCPLVSTEVPVWGPWCDCKEGYARLPNGKCMSIYDKRCSKLFLPSAVKHQCQLRGEIYRVGEICEGIPDCEYPNGPKYVCMAIGPKERCYCRSGYLRNKQQICVPKEEC